MQAVGCKVVATVGVCASFCLLNHTRPPQNLKILFCGTGGSRRHDSQSHIGVTGSQLRELIYYGDLLTGQLKPQRLKGSKVQIFQSSNSNLSIN